MQKTKTHAQYIKEIKLLYKNSIVVLENYLKNNIKIKHKCNKCGFSFKKEPIEIIRGHTCKLCNTKNRKRTKRGSKIIQSEFIKLLHKAHSGNIKLIGKFTYLTKKVKFKCLVCNNIWTTRANSTSNGVGCGVCRVLNQTKSNKHYIKEIKLLHNNKIINTENYINDKTPIRHKCLVCNHTWKPKPNTILAGNGCLNCFSKVSLKGSSKISISWFNYLEKKLKIKIKHK